MSSLNSRSRQKLVNLQEEFMKQTNKEHYWIFEGRVRYLASSQIVTIPAQVSKQLNLKLGDHVLIEIKKK